MFKKFLAAIVATAMLVVGFGAITSAPAQAVNGSTVHFQGLVNAPGAARLITTRTNGQTVYLAVGQTTYDVSRTCPSQSNLRIRYTRGAGTYTLNPGACLYPSLAAWYYVTLIG